MVALGRQRLKNPKGPTAIASLGGANKTANVTINPILVCFDMLFSSLGIVLLNCRKWPSECN